MSRSIVIAVDQIGLDALRGAIIDGCQRLNGLLQTGIDGTGKPATGPDLHRWGQQLKALQYLQMEMLDLAKQAGMEL